MKVIARYCSISRTHWASSAKLRLAQPKSLWPEDDDASPPGTIAISTKSTVTTTPPNARINLRSVAAEVVGLPHKNEDEEEQPCKRDAAAAWKAVIKIIWTLLVCITSARFDVSSSPVKMPMGLPKSLRLSAPNFFVPKSAGFIFVLTLCKLFFFIHRKSWRNRCRIWMSFLRPNPAFWIVPIAHSCWRINVQLRSDFTIVFIHKPKTNLQQLLHMPHTTLPRKS